MDSLVLCEPGQPGVQLGPKPVRSLRAATQCLHEVLPAAVLQRMEARAQQFGGHVVVAGGLVLAALSAAPQPQSDVDLFLYGFPDAFAAAAAVMAMVNALCITMLGLRPSWRILEHRFTGRALTIVLSDGPLASGEATQRSYQFILRSFSSACAILESFDLDCCKVLYEAGVFRGTVRWIWAMRSGYNLMYAWTSYRRAVKYSARGFGLLVPSAALRGAGARWDREAAGVVDYNRFATIFHCGSVTPAMAMQLELVIAGVLQLNAQMSAAEWLGTSDYVYLGVSEVC
ncbi:hypothetical protein GPECTOR_711g863 [Gonium pectorale]|uniref:Uncharacterized protein n=1 Tax=Gonium pectorale TaxID=33097 RepID=A0A150FUA9_GONPE|nr:hypothetical protein GPECTOR_711g863 [Gonium pectorale]|eukprot:KXZ41158.1 hypothetical protein GPECTOR_711g863 [Gonium pectorale]